MQFRERDGVALAYEFAPGTGVPILLVHGWCCDHTYLEPQATYFAERGHGILTVDLRGHGASDKPMQTYTMGGFADDLAWLAAELGLPKLVIVGHSMGGIVAFDFAVRYPELALATVMIDSAVVLPPPVRTRMNAFIEALKKSDYRDTLRDYALEVLVLPTDEATRTLRLLERMAEAPQHVVVSAFEGLRDFDATEHGMPLRVPGLFISADEPTSRSDLDALNSLAPHLDFGRTVGSGHFCQLEVPDQVNAMIKRFLAVRRGV